MGRYSRVLRRRIKDLLSWFQFKRVTSCLVCFPVFVACDICYFLFYFVLLASHVVTLPACVLPPFLTTLICFTCVLAFLLYLNPSLCLLLVSCLPSFIQTSCLELFAGFVCTSCFFVKEIFAWNLSCLSFLCCATEYIFCYSTYLIYKDTVTTYISPTNCWVHWSTDTDP